MNLQQTHVPSARRTFYRICFAALIATATAPDAVYRFQR